MEKNLLLEVKDLEVHFRLRRGMLKAVDGISFSVKEGESFGLVGESGSGKSVTAQSILRLISSPPASFQGKILFEGEDVLKKAEKEMLSIRGKKISMIFQESISSLNPVYTIGEQILETLRIHHNLKRKEALEQTVEMLRIVGISSSRERLNSYPHEFSGGMRQRVCIAMALSCQPSFLIADEPTTFLDVTIQKQILDLLKGEIKRRQMGLIFISHDLIIVGQMCQRLGVMYAGNLLEVGNSLSILQNPQHPYTIGLINSRPKRGEKDDLHPIRGMVCSLIEPPQGCKFHPRCNYVQKPCME